MRLELVQSRRSLVPVVFQLVEGFRDLAADRHQLAELGVDDAVAELVQTLYSLVEPLVFHAVFDAH